MSAPKVKGWCPGAYRPMASGDGLVVRVRPWLGQITGAQVRVLCSVADRFGTGVLELTNRANIQIRGVAEAAHDNVIAALLAADLLDEDPALEGRRNLVMTHDWAEGNETNRLALDLMAILPELPEMPSKFGYAIDAAPEAWVADAPADIRIERGSEGGLIVVADGSDCGVAVTIETAMETVRGMVDWFVRTDGVSAGRMARHLRNTALPEVWRQVPRRAALRPAASDRGTLLGVPFGQIDTKALRRLIDDNALKTLRVLPGRTLLAMGSSPRVPEGFCAPDDAVLNVHACAGAPGCPQALGPTRTIARQLAKTMPPKETLHISGCIKGCAFPRPADRTYVATDAGFDLVSNGAPWDAPVTRAIDPETLG